MAPPAQRVPVKNAPAPAPAPLLSPSSPRVTPPDPALSSTPVNEPEVLNSFLSSLLHPIGLVSFFGFRLAPGVEDLDTEIKAAEARSRTVSGPALTETIGRLKRLRQVKAMTDILTADDSKPEYLRIRRHDVYPLKQKAVEKLLAGIANPPSDKDFEEGKNLFLALECFSKLEQARTQLRGQIESLYPGPKYDSKIHYRLDFDDLTDKDLDIDKYPAVARLKELPVVQAYRELRDSEKEEEKKAAGYVERLFGHFREENDRYDLNTFDAPEGDPVAFVNGLNGTLESLLTDPGLKTFSERLAQVKQDRIDEKGSDAEKAQVLIGEGLGALDQYPSLATALGEYQTRVAGRVPPIPLEQQLAMLRDVCSLFVRRAERCGKYPCITSPFEGSVKEAKDLIESLDSLKGEALTQEALNDAAAKMAPLVPSFQEMEERSVQHAFSILIAEIDKLPSSGDSTLPLLKDLEKLPTSFEGRMKAYRELGKQVTVAGAIRLVESRIKILSAQRDQHMTKTTFISVAGVFAGGGIGGVSGYQSSDPYPAKFREMKTAYENILVKLKSKVPDPDSNALYPTPAQVERDIQLGLSSLSQIEGVRRHEDLNDVAEAAQTVNLGVAIGVVVLACIPLFIEAIPVAGAAAAGEVSLLELGALGLRSLLGRATFLPLAVQRGVATAGTYALASLGMTTINRNYTSLILGEEALSHGFGTEFLINLAFMGVGSGAARGASAVIDAAVEAVAIRNIAARGGAIVLAEGRAAVAPGTMNEALKTAIEMEKQTVLQGTFARFMESAGPLGAELAAFQTMECLKTAAILAHKGVSDPLGKAFEMMTNPKSQALLLGPMLVSHGLSRTTGDVSAYVPMARMAEFKAIERQWTVKTEAYKNAYESQRLPDGSLPESVTSDPKFQAKIAEILELRRDMIALTPSSERSPQLYAEHEAIRFTLGLKKVFGDGNPYGVRPCGDGETFTYERRFGEKLPKIDEVLQDLPFVHQGNVRVYPNGLIEVPLVGGGPFTPESKVIRLIPAEPRGKR